MKVAVYLRDEFTQADREQLAVVLDGYRSERFATRDEIKEFYSEHGNGWRSALEIRFAEYVQSDLENLI